jgi:hypothetical protein
MVARMMGAGKLGRDSVLDQPRPENRWRAEMGSAQSRVARPVHDIRTGFERI